MNTDQSKREVQTKKLQKTQKITINRINTSQYIEIEDDAVGVSVVVNCRCCRNPYRMKRGTKERKRREEHSGFIFFQKEILIIFVLKPC